MTAIQIDHLTKKYKDLTAVNDLSLTIEKGELFSLLGVALASLFVRLRIKLKI